jgi:hypothetical protein
MASGTVSRIGAYPRARHAIEAMQRAEAAAKPDAKDILVYHTWDENGRTGTVGFSNKGSKLFDLTTDAESVAIKAELQAAGISADKVRMVLDQLDAMSLRRAHIGARGNKRLEGPGGAEAEMLPTDQAIAEYYQQVASRSGVAEWRVWAVDNFKKKYADVLNPDKDWHDPSAIVAGVFRGAKKGSPALRSSELNALAKEARKSQAWIQRAITQRTRWERGADNWLDQTALNMAHSKNIGMKALNRLMDNKGFRKLFPIFSSEFNNSMRGVGAVPKLMFFGTAQIAVQGFQVATTVGANPIHAMGALQDVMKATAARIVQMNSPTTKISRNSDFLLELARRSGYLADLDTSDLMKLARHGLNPSIGATFMKVAASPFRLGEAMNRSMAFYTSRRVLLHKLEKGTLKGLDRKPFHGAIDDDEFLRLVTDRAKVTALNMGRAGQVELLSGPGSVLLQFKQVLGKALHVFESGTLTMREKMGASAAMLAMFGPAGIPFIPDLVWGLDELHGLINDNPSDQFPFSNASKAVQRSVVGYLSDLTPQEAKDWGLTDEFYTRLTSKGIIFAMTEGEIDIVSRVSLGRFMSESMEMMRPEDAIVSVSVLWDLCRTQSARQVPR